MKYLPMLSPEISDETADRIHQWMIGVSAALLALGALLPPA